MTNEQKMELNLRQQAVDGMMDAVRRLEQARKALAPVDGAMFGLYEQRLPDDITKSISLALRTLRHNLEGESKELKRLTAAWNKWE